MNTVAEAGRKFWHDVLVAGGFTGIPRWTLDRVPGVAEHDAMITDDLVVGLRRVAQELAVSVDSVLLAAHAKVLAALSGEREITTGYVAPGSARVLPCRVSTNAGSWRELLDSIHRTEADLLSHQDFPFDELRAELGLSGSSFEVVFTATGEGKALTRTVTGDLASGVVLQVGFSRYGDRWVLWLRYRTEVLDAAAADRIAGYHLRALALIAADPDAEHTRQSLLGAEELHFQIEGLAGERRELPDARVHELFEGRVIAHPNAIAAVHGDREWTYQQLNARANQLGRALLARGLRREDVVAVVTERTLDWMASVLAIFKAGGTYLPLEPHFPAGRIATALSRAQCRLVLTERGSSDTLHAALEQLPEIQVLYLDTADAEHHPEGNLGIEVAPDQLAYLLFTSGSTGEPKGAMCEHAGMLNHLYAKITDLGIGEGEIISQTAPQCFDISIWQLLAASLVGGRTLLISQEVILDIERFVDTIIDGRAGVLQIVPSYLDVLVSYLETHPRQLPDLHAVSPTGDALKKELVHRWFAIQPNITLVNAYGLTETSDDAVHEIMHRVPDSDQIPLGRPIINAWVYVLDEHLSPVPLGAPGLIAISGICVGRGYINDPERTRGMFMPDPHREGQRLCLTGDYGRWQPGVTLEFLGRRDTQHKIRGFRIDIGEIDNALLRVPGIRDGAVVVTGTETNKRLVAFYAGPHPLAPTVLTDQLGQKLPEYMLPSAFHWQASLPLTPNGKIDRTTLAALATDLATSEATEQDHHTPTTATEQRLAASWAMVLGVPAQEIDRRDHFFHRGGTSLTAVKLAITLDRVISLKDIIRHPILADLADLIDNRSPQHTTEPSHQHPRQLCTAQA